MGIYIKGFQLPEKSAMYYVKVECADGKNPIVTIWQKDLLGEMSFGVFEVFSINPKRSTLILAEETEEVT